MTEQLTRPASLEDTPRDELTAWIGYLEARLEKAGEAANTLEQVCEVFGIGTAVRSASTILANARNCRRFADYLHAIEIEFFMVPGEPDEEFPGEDPDPVCQLNSWGASSRENYVEQFKVALALRDAQVAADALVAVASDWETRKVSHSAAYLLREEARRRQAEGVCS